MGKKIGILTLYYKNENYGGVLQAFALQKALSNMGAEAKQISYRMESGYPDSWKKIFYDKIKIIVKVLIRQKWNKKHSAHRRKIYEFADTIPHTKAVSNRELSNLSDDFEWFVVGSDQVWNPMGWQPAFFFDFLSNEKHCMSYAASMARDFLSTNEILFIEKYLNKFDFISVRENETAKILKKSFPNKNIEVMPDPAILLTAEEWDEVACNKLFNESYVFAYCLGLDFEKRNQIIRDAEKKGFKAVFVPYMDKKSFDWDCQNCDYTMEGIGIPEFLSLIKNAEYVITDSFHGTVFSLIFHTRFYSFYRFKNSEIDNMNSRISTLLQMFDLDDRAGEDIPPIIEDIDWDKIDATLGLVRNKGLGYLSSCIWSDDCLLAKCVDTASV